MKRVRVVLMLLLMLSCVAWSCVTLDAQVITGGIRCVEVKEADGSPDVTCARTLIFNNGTVTNNGNGSVSIDNSGGGGGSGDVTDVGDCATGACFKSGGTGTLLFFQNATSGSVTLKTVTGALGTQNILLPAESGTICTTATVCPGYQASLTNPITGTGTTNTLAKFTGASALGDSHITDDGTTINLASQVTQFYSAAPASGNDYRALERQQTLTLSGSSSDHVYGEQHDMLLNGTGTRSFVYGKQIQIYDGGGAGSPTITNLWGIQVFPQRTSGTFTGYDVISASPTSTSAIGYNVDALESEGDIYGVFVNTLGAVSSSPNNIYGVYIQDQTNGAGDKYGLYNLGKTYLGNDTILADTKVIRGENGSGSNQVGSNAIFAGGQGTGTGVGGSILLQTAPAGSTGSSLNALVTRLSISGDGSASWEFPATKSLYFFPTGEANFLYINNTDTQTVNLSVSGTSFVTGYFGVNDPSDSAIAHMGIRSTSNTLGGLYIQHDKSGDQGASSAGTNGLQIRAAYNGTNPNSPTTGMLQALQIEMHHGESGVAAVGSSGTLNMQNIITANGDNLNDHYNVFSGLRADIGTGYTQSGGNVGNLWMYDNNLHGAIAVQPRLLTLWSGVQNNYYNGSPSGAKSSIIALVTGPGNGGFLDSTHNAATTYANDYALSIQGASTGTGAGFTTAIRIGGTDAIWTPASSKIGTGLHLTDYVTNGILIASRFSGATGPAIAVDSTAGGVVLGGTAAVMNSGELAGAKITASGSAPGAGYAKMSWVAGTNSGTCKLISYAGTSTTPVTIIDNVGGSC